MDQTPNAHKFNAGTEYNDFTDTYDTPFRQYDPATGRFNGVDALAHMAPSLTPYRFGFNNPVSFNDPTGLMERPIILNTDRTNGGGGCILSGADNFGSMAFLTGKMGIGSGRYHISSGYSGSGGSSVSSISRRLMNSSYGGTWSSSGGYSYFSSHGEAFNVGAGYNDYHGSWRHVSGGYSGAMKRGVSAGLVRNKKVKKVVDQFGGYIWKWENNINYSIFEDQRGGKVDLSNPNDRELYNQILGAYQRTRSGELVTNDDLFDFSKVKYTEYQQWERTLNFKNDGKDVTVRVVLINPIPNPESNHFISGYALYNGAGHRNPSKWPGIINGKIIVTPFMLQFENSQRETQANFFFGRSAGTLFSNFQSYLNTGNSKYLAK